jgi:endoglucanase Acf2
LTTKGVPSIVLTSTSPCLGAMDCSCQDILLPVGIGAPPANTKPKIRHPAPRLGINGMTGPIQTNKFLCELLLGVAKIQP